MEWLAAFCTNPWQWALPWAASLCKDETSKFDTAAKGCDGSECMKRVQSNSTTAQVNLNFDVLRTVILS